MLRRTLRFMLALGSGAAMASCAALPSPPPVPYSEILRVRHEFLDGEAIGLAYDPVMWDGMIEGKDTTSRHVFGPNPKTGKYELAFYVRVKNLSDSRLRVAPTEFSLTTVGGETYSPGTATASTSQPFPMTELQPQGSTEGYIVFELPPDALAKDQPSLLQYDDGAGHRAVRYLSTPDMVRYEGLSPVVSEEVARPRPPPGGERQPKGRWETRWVPGHWYGNVWYPGRYATLWIEGR